MTDELGSSVSGDSLKVYRAMFNPPTPWFRITMFLGLFALCGWLAWLTTNTYQARLCYDRGGTMIGGACKAPTIEVKHYMINMPPADEQQNQIPEPAPPPAPPGTSL